jgi:antitoxin VapB
MISFGWKVISYRREFMAFHIHDPETDRLVRELARREGVGLTETVKRAVEDALKRRAKSAGEADDKEADRILENFYRRFPPPADRTPVTREEIDDLYE